MTFSIAEVRRNGDDCVGDVFAEVSLCVALQLHQCASTDFLWGVRLTVNVDGPIGTHVTLNRPNGAINVGHSLALGNFTNEHLAVLCESHNGRGGPSTFSISDDDGFSAFKN